MKRAIILAGGKAERLRPITEAIPKCMVEVLGRPILAYQIHWLRSYGISEVYLACGYRHDLIEDYFGNGSSQGVRIHYLVEDKPLGRGGALKNALKAIGGTDDIVALNGDNICNLVLSEIYSFHQTHTGLVTLVTAPLRSNWGIVNIGENNVVQSFSEKPELPYRINAGIYLLRPQITELLPDVGDHETCTFPKLAAEGQLYAYSKDGFWRTIDTVKDVNELKTELEQMFLGALFQPDGSKAVSK